ncbi:MAG: T9SS type A sorting domain-containing protein [Ferruginibacter sp.]
MTESSKVGGSFQVARLTTGLEKQFSTRLYLVTGTELALYDGNRVDFDPMYSNITDDNDMPKMSNFGESIGLLREAKSFSVERRAEVVSTDTIFYNLGNMRQKEYQLEFTPDNLASPVLTAYLEDAYLNTRTEISLADTTTVNFVVNADAASKAPDRFRVVFKLLGPVPVSFTSVRANRQEKNILVTWNIENEMDIANYEVERSADGHNFNKIGTQIGRNTAGSTSQQYNLLDIAPLIGDNFYRIKSVGISGDVKYSEIVKVNMKGDPSMITVYPNPVKEDGIVRVSLTNEPAGIYHVNLINAAGQTILSRTIIHEGGNSVYNIGLDKSVAHGNYMLQVAEGNKVKTTLKILY